MDPDELFYEIKIYDRSFNTFTALHTFVKEAFPRTLYDFEQKYGECSST
jgi:hypothetical protein